MKLRNALAALVATSLVSAPVVVQAAAASVQNARSGSDVEGDSLIGIGIIPLLAILGALAAGIAIIDEEDEDDQPTSP
jgi:hypothetical protein